MGEKSGGGEDSYQVPACHVSSGPHLSELEGKRRVPVHRAVKLASVRLQRSRIVHTDIVARGWALIAGARSEDLLDYAAVSSDVHALSFSSPKAQPNKRRRAGHTPHYFGLRLSCASAFREGGSALSPFSPNLWILSACAPLFFRTSSLVGWELPDKCWWMLCKGGVRPMSERYPRWRAPRAPLEPTRTRCQSALSTFSKKFDAEAFWHQCLGPGSLFSYIIL